jgi:hypothetical protein
MLFQTDGVKAELLKTHSFKFDACRDDTIRLPLIDFR